VHFLTEKGHILRFEPPFGGFIGTMYAVHLRFVGKIAVDFLLVIMELFSNR